MSSPSRTPSDDYSEAVRLLAASESSRTESIQIADALIGIGYAILAGAPRRARRRPSTNGRHVTGGSPRDRWIAGLDNPEGNDQS
jgi:hypothetical protein